jgi:CRP/FNR family transcriptional regulator, anaerobic regulatory protein
LKTFKTGDFFLEAEKECAYLGFVENGIFQFYVEKDAEIITTYIALENDFIISVKSFLAATKSNENIRALTDARVWMITKSDFDKLLHDIDGFKEVYIKLLEKLLVCIDESRFNYITLKPKERYLKLIKEEPKLLQQVPLKYLSALLGITPRQLSRIRDDIRQ